MLVCTKARFSKPHSAADQKGRGRFEVVLQNLRYSRHQGRRQIEQLAEQQQAILFRLNGLEDEDDQKSTAPSICMACAQLRQEVRAASFARWSASRDEMLGRKLEGRLLQPE